MVSPVASPIMFSSPVRPGWPSFMTTTAAAPAACALSTLTLKPHVPRWTSATDPAGMPAKSAASQPLVLLFGGAARDSSTRSDRDTADPVAVPSGDPESNVFRRKSVPLTKSRGFGLTRMSSEFSSK